VTAPPPDPPPDIRLVLRPLVGEVPIEIRLRRLLKALLRGYGFRCLRIEDVPTKEQGGKCDTDSVE